MKIYRVTTFRAQAGVASPFHVELFRYRNHAEDYFYRAKKKGMNTRLDVVDVNTSYTPFKYRKIKAARFVFYAG